MFNNRVDEQVKRSIKNPLKIFVKTSIYAINLPYNYSITPSMLHDTVSTYLGTGHRSKVWLSLRTNTGIPPSFPLTPCPLFLHQPSRIRTFVRTSLDGQIRSLTMSVPFDPVSLTRHLFLKCLLSGTETFRTDNLLSNPLVRSVLFLCLPFHFVWFEERDMSILVNTLIRLFSGNWSIYFILLDYYSFGNY